MFTYLLTYNNPGFLCVAAGAERFPRSVAGRVVLGLWWVFTILTTASYTASLAAFLTFSMAHVPINSIYDLAEQSQVLPLVKNGTNLYTLFNVSEARRSSSAVVSLFCGDVLSMCRQRIALYKSYLLVLLFSISLLHQTKTMGRKRLSF